MDWQIILPFVYYGIVAAVAAIFLVMRDKGMQPQIIGLLAIFWPLTIVVGLPLLGLRWAFTQALQAFADTSADKPGELGMRLTAIEKDIKEMKAMTAWLVRRAEQSNK
ncbi:MAG: hypothetical protein Q7T73_10115 [Beijerinckiaceae bacterium]|jgi:hypothetical protein|nr:hypothetical protein [Beijerinckiaceae bacterium]